MDDRIDRTPDDWRSAPREEQRDTRMSRDCTYKPFPQFKMFTTFSRRLMMLVFFSTFSILAYERSGFGDRDQDHGNQSSNGYGDRHGGGSRDYGDRYGGRDRDRGGFGRDFGSRGYDDRGPSDGYDRGSSDRFDRGYSDRGYSRDSRDDRGYSRDDRSYSRDNRDDRGKLIWIDNLNLGIESSFVSH